MWICLHLYWFKRLLESSRHGTWHKLNPKPLSEMIASSKNLNFPTTDNSSSAAVVCFEDYLPRLSKEIRCFLHLCAPVHFFSNPSTLCSTQPPTPLSSEEVCWWMLKAALVPQQLTLLLQEAACQLDGISTLLLPVTQTRRGQRTNASTTCLLYCFCLRSRARTSNELRGAL